MFWNRKEKKLKGSYIIIHYIAVGNMRHDGDITPERLAQLENTEDYVKEDLKTNEKSELDQYIEKYKKENSLKEKYVDLIEELFIPIHIGGVETHIEILNFY